MPSNFSKCKVLNIVTAKIYSCLIFPCSVVVSLPLWNLCLFSAWLFVKIWSEEPCCRAVKRESRIFIFVNLRRTQRLPGELHVSCILCFYLVTSFVFRYLVFCNVPSCFTLELASVDRRVFCILGSWFSFLSLFQVVQSSGLRLMRAIESSSNHSLRSILRVKYQMPADLVFFFC